MNIRYQFIVPVLLLLFALVACGGSGSSGGGGGSGAAVTTVSASIGATGGTLSGPDGVTIVVPAGALSVTTNLTVARDSGSAPALPGSITSLGRVYVLTPHGTTFSVPITISIPFDPSLVPTGQTPTLYKAELNGSFATISTSINGNMLVADISNFSYVAPALPPQPSSAAVTYGQLSGNCGRQALSGKIDCWGDIRTITGDTTLSTAKPTTVAGGRAFGQFSASADFLCGISAGTEVWCAGDNFYGNLGNGTTTSAPNGVKVTAPAGISLGMVTTGLSHACGLVQASGPSVDGTIYCWGFNMRGQIGVGTAGSAPLYPTPVLVGSPNSAVRYIDVKAGGSVTCATRTTGEVDCWGDNSYGQAGIGYVSNGYTVTPTQVPGVVLATFFNSLAVSYGTICGIRGGAGDTVCWGNNFNGQVGDGTKGTGNTGSLDFKPPTVVAGGYAFKEVIQAGYAGCGRLATGDTYCWGNSANLTPLIVSVPNLFKSLSSPAGGNSFCGIGWADSKTYCWGDNSWGQLGQGNTTPASNATPTPLPNQ